MTFKRFLWNLNLAASMLMMFSAVQYTLLNSPLGILVMAGTASWLQIVFFFLVLISPACVATELLLQGRWR